MYMGVRKYPMAIFALNTTTIIFQCRFQCSFKFNAFLNPDFERTIYYYWPLSDKIQLRNKITYRMCNVLGLINITKRPFFRNVCPSFLNVTTTV